MPTKILVVEDQADSREMLSAILQAEGFTVVCAEDGLDGLYLVETNQPDFIITDLQMPNLDGIALIKRLREHPQWSGIPVLVLSAYDSGMMSEAFEAGASGAIHKPAQLAHLMDTIKQLLTVGSSISLLIYTGLTVCML